MADLARDTQRAAVRSARTLLRHRNRGRCSERREEKEQRRKRSDAPMQGFTRAAAYVPVSGHEWHVQSFWIITFFGAALGDHRFDHVVTYFHRYQSGDSSQQYFGDFAFEMVACTESHGLLLFGSGRLWGVRDKCGFGRNKGAPLLEGALPSHTSNCLYSFT